MSIRKGINYCHDGKVLLTSWRVIRSCGLAEEAEAITCRDSVRLRAFVVRLVGVQPRAVTLEIPLQVRICRYQPKDRVAKVSHPFFVLVCQGFVRAGR